MAALCFFFPRDIYFSPLHSDYINPPLSHLRKHLTVLRTPGKLSGHSPRGQGQGAGAQTPLGVGDALLLDLRLFFGLHSSNTEL